MARINYFNELSFGKRAALVSTKGNFIGSRYYYQQKVILYSVKKLFVEVTYEPESNTIIRIEEIQYPVLERFYLKEVRI